MSIMLSTLFNILYYQYDRYILAIRVHCCPWGQIKSNRSLNIIAIYNTTILHTRLCWTVSDCVGASLHGHGEEGIQITHISLILLLNINMMYSNDLQEC